MRELDDLGIPWTVVFQKILMQDLDMKHVEQNCFMVQLQEQVDFHVEVAKDMLETANGDQDFPS